MKKIELILNGTTYSKDEPTVQDWYDNIESVQEIEEGINTPKGMNAYINVVAKYLNAPEEDIKKYASLKQVTEAFNTVNRNLLECFGAAGGMDNATGKN